MSVRWLDAALQQSLTSPYSAICLQAGTLWANVARPAGDGWVNWSGLATAIEELLQVYLQGLQALLNLEKTLATTPV
jgi:hypothetical protein